MSSDTRISTTVSKMYDVVLFAELETYNNTLLTVQNPYVKAFKNIINGTFAGYVFMNLMPTSWNILYNNTSSNGFIGPYVEYDHCPTSGVVARRNGLSIERYCAKYTNNMDYQLLARQGIRYDVYGLMLRDEIANLFR